MLAATPRAGRPSRLDALEPENVFALKLFEPEGDVARDFLQLWNDLEL